MPDLGLGSLLAFSALTLSFVAAKPLGDLNIRVPTIFAAAASLTLIASIVRLALLTGWWTILAFFLAIVGSALLMRPAFKVGGRGTIAILGWIGYIVPLALVLCVASWFITP